jgi:dihydrofolate reductase
MTVPVIMVAAMARNRVIGIDNGLPWHMRSDLKHFKAATMGKPMIMGRKTYQSIGRLLPGRETIIVTHDPGFMVPGAHTAGDLKAALHIGQQQALAMAATAVIIAGGAAIYRQALPFADRMILTELDLDATGDATFPGFDPAKWREVSRVDYPRGEGDDASFSIVNWQRD